MSSVYVLVTTARLIFIVDVISPRVSVKSTGRMRNSRICSTRDKVLLASFTAVVISACRSGSLIRSVAQADGERGLGVRARVGPERDVGVSTEHSVDLAQPPGDDVGEVLVFGDLDDRDEVDVAGAGVDLAHSVEIGDGLRGLRNPELPLADQRTRLVGRAARGAGCVPALRSRWCSTGLVWWLLRRAARRGACAVQRPRRPRRRH
jgi:hypothetical protein